MNKIAKLQFLQSKNRQVICKIQENIINLKLIKREADEAGYLEVEYRAHSNLQHARRELKKWVEIQMDCKEELREEYNWERMIKAVAEYKEPV